MERNIVNFENAELRANIRVIDRDGEPWFVLCDLCGVLDTRTNDAMSGLDDDEKGYDNIASPGGTQQMAIVSEAGLYSLILRSRKPEAKIFKRWITHDVLPSIRKHGAYMTPPTIDAMLSDPRAYAELLLTIAAERERKEILEDREAVFGNRTRYGSLSQFNGRPRIDPVRGYLRTTKTTIIEEVTESQRRLFDWR